jgi:Mg2+/Co2+ transporter CorB|tara:strand:- start:849 stop:2093 length:1245 start_codon:yes stop_codon:yes gene_type:complete
MTLIVIIKILAIIILLLLSALSSGSETALTAVSKQRAFRQRDKGAKNANFILKIKDFKDEFITGILLANNLFNILATALMTELLVSEFGGLGVTVATIFMTLMIVIFSEVTPKIFAINKPMTFALRVSKFFYFYTKLIKPIVNLINKISNKIIKIIGLNLNADQSKIIEEEFEGAVQLQKQYSKDGEYEADYMSNILELKKLKVDELMTHRNEILYINLDDPYKQNLKIISTSAYTRIPVIKGNFNNLIGIFDIRDLLKDSSMEESNESIERNTSQPVYIPQNKLAMKQLIDFKSSREHMVLIVDEYGEIQGLITLEDIIEEIIGEIFDETDTDETYLEKIDDSNYLFNGNASVREINRSLDINLPDQFVTLSGLIHDLAKEIPKVGKVFYVGDIKLQIISRSINKINKVKLSI